MVTYTSSANFPCIDSFLFFSLSCLFASLNLLHSRASTIMRINRTPFTLVIFIFICSLSQAEETITSTKPIRDPEAITSSDGTFKLGFFSLGNSSNRYVGVWFNKIQEQTVVWVANREAPLRDFSGVFTVDGNQNLVVLDGKRNVLWATNVTNDASSSHAELLSSGNLLLREGNSSGNGRILWQSFNNPSNVYLPEMKLIANLRTGEKQVVQSWKSDTDPSPGNFYVEVDSVSSIPQVIIKNGSKRFWRSGPWNGRAFIGVQQMSLESVYKNGFTVVRDNQENCLYVTYSYVNDSVLTGYFLSPKGVIVQQNWEEGDQKWVEEWSEPNSECGVYGHCGPFGNCDILKSPICSCLKGFVPKSEEEWSKGNWSAGCVRRTQLQCQRKKDDTKEAKTDGFLKLQRMKVPDFVISIGDQDMQQCEDWCLFNCSCIAYAYETGAGCMWWIGNLIDIETFSDGGVDLFIRVANSELDKKSNLKVTLVSTGAGMFIICVLAYIVWMKNKKEKKRKANINVFSDSEKLGDNSELPIFSFEKLMIATNNFDSANKLGQGGFGPVYKGKLRDGQEIAVKRLSRSSGQGIEEFKNEVVVISKLQHRNLVKLLGCCIEGNEKMLIYEYMPNKSLDAFIFDPTKKALIDWRKRFQIIMGICRGLLYLHRDSRLKVIHRDLKTSNILLDEELNPKISDFGMARIFSGNELQANTIRVVGTYGYMSPEYAMKGQFSEKSDVFSFGVLLLELVTGKRNNNFYYNKKSWTLLGFAWELLNERRSQELIDPFILESSDQEEILRCIHVGLLCVQDFPKDRPTMSSIISMLTSEITSLPIPKQPAFTGGLLVSDSETSQSSSMNYVSMTSIGGR